jgi:hypothetical protein
MTNITISKKNNFGTEDPIPRTIMDAKNVGKGKRRGQGGQRKQPTAF